MISLFKTTIVSSLLLLCISCQVPPEVIASIDNQMALLQHKYAQGQITQEAYEEQMETLQFLANRLSQQSPLDWRSLLVSAGQVGIAVLASMYGINKVRGPAKPMNPAEIEALRSIVARREQ